MRTFLLVLQNILTNQFRFVQGVYKPDEKASYDEYSDVSQSFDFLSQLALEWEAAARLPSDVEDVRQVIVRSG